MPSEGATMSTENLVDFKIYLSGQGYSKNPFLTKREC